jgi:phospholipid transport system substrate-binding protein
MRKIGILVGSVAALGLATMIAAHAGQNGVQRGGSQVMDRPDTANVPASAWRAGQIWPKAEIDDLDHLDLLLADNTLSEATISQLAAIAPAAGPETINPDQAILALRKLSSDAISVLQDGRLDAAHRVAKFHGLMARDFDIPLMARFALGRHWKRADQSQRSAYVEAFSAFMLHQYASKIGGAQISSFDVQSAYRAGKRDVMVQSRITQHGGRVVKLVWRMRQRNGQFRVIDVVAEGISLALTKRQEFAAIIKANGGKVAPLIHKLLKITA